MLKLLSYLRISMLTIEMQTARTVWEWNERPCHLDSSWEEHEK